MIEASCHIPGAFYSERAGFSMPHSDLGISWMEAEFLPMTLAGRHWRHYWPKRRSTRQDESPAGKHYGFVQK
jgi:hypothetical protein